MLLSLLVLIKLLQNLFVIESVFIGLAVLELLLDRDLVIKFMFKEFLLVLDVRLAFLFTFVVEILVVPGDRCPFILLASELEFNIGSVLLGLFLVFSLLPQRILL